MYVTKDTYCHEKLYGGPTATIARGQKVPKYKDNSTRRWRKYTPYPAVTYSHCEDHDPGSRNRDNKMETSTFNCFNCFNCFSNASPEDILLSVYIYIFNCNIPKY